MRYSRKITRDILSVDSTCANFISKLNISFLFFISFHLGISTSLHIYMQSVGVLPLEFLNSQMSYQVSCEGRKEMESCDSPRFVKVKMPRFSNK